MFNFDWIKISWADLEILYTTREGMVGTAVALATLFCCCEYVYCHAGKSACGASCILTEVLCVKASSKVLRTYTTRYPIFIPL